AGGHDLLGGAQLELGVERLLALGRHDHPPRPVAGGADTDARRHAYGLRVSGATLCREEATVTARRAPPPANLEDRQQSRGGADRRSAAQPDLAHELPPSEPCALFHKD